MKKLSLILTFLLLTILCVSCGEAQNETPSIMLGFMRQTPEVVPTITMEKFDALEKGMSYKEAFDIIGGEGINNSYRNLDGIVSRTYDWPAEAPVHGVARVVFTSNKLESKEWCDYSDILAQNTEESAE